MVIKSLGLINTKIYLKQTTITYKELAFYLIKILRDIITVYILFYFLFNKAVNPPITKIYINPAIFYQRSYLTTLYKILKTIIFFNIKK